MSVAVAHQVSPTSHLAIREAAHEALMRDTKLEVLHVTESFDLDVEQAHKGRYVLKAASGDVRIGVAEGTPVWTDITTISGRVRSDLTPVGPPQEGQDHLEIRATSASGDITLQQI